MAKHPQHKQHHVNVEPKAPEQEVKEPEQKQEQETMVSEIDRDPATLEALKIEPEAAPTTIAPQTAPTEPPKPMIIWPEYDKEEFAKCANISQRIRYLHSTGKWSRGQIARFLSEQRGRRVLYQHVRNVLLVPLKKQAETTQN